MKREKCIDGEGEERRERKKDIQSGGREGSCSGGVITDRTSEPHPFLLLLMIMTVPFPRFRLANGTPGTRDGWTVARRCCLGTKQKVY